MPCRTLLGSTGQHRAGRGRAVSCGPPLQMPYYAQRACGLIETGGAGGMVISGHSLAAHSRRSFDASGAAQLFTRNTHHDPTHGGNMRSFIKFRPCRQRHDTQHVGR